MTNKLRKQNKQLEKDIQDLQNKTNSIKKKVEKQENENTKIRVGIDLLKLKFKRFLK